MSSSNQPTSKLVVSELKKAFPNLGKDSDVDYEALILGTLLTNPQLAEIFRSAVEHSKTFEISGKTYTTDDIINITTISSEVQGNTHILGLKSKETGVSIVSIGEKQLEDLAKGLREKVTQQKDFQEACYNVFSAWYAVEDDIKEQMLVAALNAIENHFGKDLATAAATAANKAKEDKAKPSVLTVDNQPERLLPQRQRNLEVAG